MLIWISKSGIFPLVVKSNGAVINAEPLSTALSKFMHKNL